MTTSTELLSLKAAHVHAGDDLQSLWWPDRAEHALYLHTETGLMMQWEDVCLKCNNGDQQIAALDFYYLRGSALIDEQTHSALWSYLNDQRMGLGDLFKYDGPDLLRLLKARVPTRGDEVQLILVFTWVISVYRDSEGYADCDEEWALRGVLDMETMPKSADPWTALLRMQPAVEKETRPA